MPDKTPCRLARLCKITRSLPITAGRPYRSFISERLADGERPVASPMAQVAFCGRSSPDIGRSFFSSSQAWESCSSLSSLRRTASGVISSDQPRLVHLESWNSETSRPLLDASLIKICFHCFSAVQYRAGFPFARKEISLESGSLERFSGTVRHETRPFLSPRKTRFAALSVPTSLASNNPHSGLMNSLDSTRHFRL